VGTGFAIKIMLKQKIEPRSDFIRMDQALERHRIFSKRFFMRGPDLPDDYRPSEGEPFMSERQLAYFRKKLIDWKSEILRASRETLENLQDTGQHPDLTDRASSETERALELRARDRQRKLIAKIDEAITRIDDGSYGYCIDTGEPISLKRLEARPVVERTLEAQERHERRERIYRDE